MSQPVNPISTIQFIFLITGIQSSVVFLSLPRVLAMAAGTDGWLAIPASWLISSAAAYVIVKIMEYEPDGNILDLLRSTIGNWASRIAAALFAIYFFTFAYDGFIITWLVTKIWLLPNTSIYVLAVLFLLPTVFIARHGLQVITRYVLIVVLLSAWIPIMYLITLKDAEWLYLLPLFKEGWSPVLPALHKMIYPTLGMIAVFFLYPHLCHKRAATAAILTANTLTHLVYLFITIVSFVFFSPNEIVQLNSPVISIMKSLEFNFIERVEVPFIAFYLLIFSLNSIPACFLVSYNLQRVLNKGSFQVYLGVVFAATMLVVWFNRPNVMQIDVMNNTLAMCGLAMEYTLPVCLLIYLKFRQRRMKA